MADCTTARRSLSDRDEAAMTFPVFAHAPSEPHRVRQVDPPHPAHGGGHDVVREAQRCPQKSGLDLHASIAKAVDGYRHESRLEQPAIVCSVVLRQELQQSDAARILVTVSHRQGRIVRRRGFAWERIGMADGGIGARPSHTRSCVHDDHPLHARG